MYAYSHREQCTFHFNRKVKCCSRSQMFCVNISTSSIGWYSRMWPRFCKRHTHLAGKWSQGNLDAFLLVKPRKAIFTQIPNLTGLGIRISVYAQSTILGKCRNIRASAVLLRADISCSDTGHPRTGEMCNSIRPSWINSSEFVGVCHHRWCATQTIMVQCHCCREPGLVSECSA